MKISQFDYKLDKKYIANKPAVPRDSSKLLVLDRKSGSIEHKIFNLLPYILNANDVLVFNESRVMPARLHGHKESGGKVEVLLLKERKNTWECICKNISKPGTKIIFENNLVGVVTKKENKICEISFNLSRVKFRKYLEEFGNMPLPPYIDNSWVSNIDSKGRREIKTLYNTIYAKDSGSAAAPTAGLHFTKDLLSKLKKTGIELEYLTLHVGLGTFEPVQTESLHNHVMHSEQYFLSPSVAQYLNTAKKAGRRIIAVGTTTTRVLESCTDKNGILMPGTGYTNIFIYPPYQFRFIDGLITNFHLPKSTLLSLVSAFVSEPNTHHKFKNFLSSPIGKAYQEAIKKNYRFFSFGDAMLVI